MDGLLLVDKPVGPTSHDVVGRVRRLSGTRRVGHAGTLDPLASGLLVVCLGRATRLLDYVVGQPKAYRATVRLGQETTTYDAEGEVVAEQPVAVRAAAVEAVLGRFRGHIEQVPPMFSAVKQSGRPLYVLARQGLEVARAPRPVTIYALDLLAYEPPDLELRIDCSSGTYVRALAHDLGQALGTGAHLAALRRTAVGRFQVDDAVPLDDLTAENLADHLRPAAEAVAHLPRLALPDEQIADLVQGRAIPHAAGQPDAPIAAAYDAAGQFVGIVAPKDGDWWPEKILASR
jgi:tRNA pseudouridine55 synthase